MGSSLAYGTVGVALGDEEVDEGEGGGGGAAYTPPELARRQAAITAER